MGRRSGAEVLLRLQGEQGSYCPARVMRWHIAQWLLDSRYSASIILPFSSFRAALPPSSNKGMSLSSLVGHICWQECPSFPFLHVLLPISMFMGTAMSPLWSLGETQKAYLLEKSSPSGLGNFDFLFSMCVCFYQSR